MTPTTPAAPDAEQGDQAALDYHRTPRAGKIAIAATKPMATQAELSLAYSPGVAAPVRAIAASPDDAYAYTAKGNLVGVVSNGTAILGLGDLGALASKPVMEGKVVLFKRFADIDAFDIEVATRDPAAFIEVVRNIAPTFGGINLEDIKAPECFEIEQRLQDLDIPVFHDDQHGTAIIASAGVLNACELTGRRLSEIRVVIVGAGAAALSTVALLKTLGLKPDNALLVDRKGVIHNGRATSVDSWKAAHAAETPHRTLAEAMAGADVLIGLSGPGLVSAEMVASMAPHPIIFALANPDPEITPEQVRAVRNDAIVATGRSDHPNQVNNVLGFPYIFRGALDVRARCVNEAMKLAAVRALAALAREPVPAEVIAAHGGRPLAFGPEYIIPSPFDPRLIWYVPPFVAEAAMQTGAARLQFGDLDAYREALKQRAAARGRTG